MESMLKPSARRLFAALCALAVSAVVVLGMAFAPARALAAEWEVADDPFAHGATVKMDDGMYEIDAMLDGGSGKASIDSPAQMEVRDGVAVVTVQWSSPNYDYMVVGDLKYLPQNTSGNSVFTIPVLSLDDGFTVIGDTTAMSTPHEVEYKLTLDSASAKAAGSSASASQASASSASASASSSASSASASASSSSASSASSQAAGAAASSSDNTMVIIGIVALVVVAGIVVYVVRGRNRG